MLKNIRSNIRRHYVLASLAGVAGFLFLRQLSFPFPQATARLSIGAVVSAAAVLFLRRLFRSKRMGLRTLV